ncbi:MAG: CASC3 protein CASC3 [Eggerthellaceae bacterium]|jgi:lipopolysaccharide/colanic/teichoic acid biosynthesis glycosyltransferase
MAKKNKQSVKRTAKQRAERERAAREREERAKAARERAQKRKQIFTIVVCIILVLALGIPTMAIAVFGGGA